MARAIRKGRIDDGTNPRKTPFTRGGVLAAVAATLLAVTFTPAPAAGAPPAAPVTCTLHASGSARTGGWSSCVQVTATLDRAPRVGETARLTVTVLGERDRSDVPVQEDLPAG